MANQEESFEFNEPRKYVRRTGKYFSILSIDGGGVRGIIPSIVLSYIEKRTGRPVNENFSLVAGTSTGALLGLILTVPKEDPSETNDTDDSTKPKATKYIKEPKYCTEDTLNLYLKECPKIFETNIFKRIGNLWGLISARYSTTSKRKVVDSYAQGLTINDCLTDIIVPAFDIREGTPHFFKSTLARTDPKFNYKLVDVLDATSAAPTYFKPCKVIGMDCNPELEYRCFVDGALAANCPALCAVADAIKVYNEDYDKIILLSLGCGNGDIGVTFESSSSWGGLSWATFFPNALINGSMLTVNYQIEQVILPKNHFRVQVKLPPQNTSIDDSSATNMEYLRKMGEKVVELNKEKLDRFCDLLME